MGILRGIISDKLRAKFGADDPAWTPPRPADAKPSKKPAKTPKGVEGHKLGGRHRQ